MKPALFSEEPERPALFRVLSNYKGKTVTLGLRLSPNGEIYGVGSYFDPDALAPSVKANLTSEEVSKAIALMERDFDAGERTRDHYSEFKVVEVSE